MTGDEPKFMSVWGDMKDTHGCRGLQRPKQCIERDC